MNEREMDEQVEYWAKWITETPITLGSGLTDESQELVTIFHQAFPEFLFDWEETQTGITVHLIKSDAEAEGLDLEVENIMSAAARVVGMGSQPISEERQGDFVAVANEHGVAVQFKEMRGLPIEVINRVFTRVLPRS